MTGSTAMTGALSAAEASELAQLGAASQPAYMKAALSAMKGVGEGLYETAKSTVTRPIEEITSPWKGAATAEDFGRATVRSAGALVKNASQSTSRPTALPLPEINTAVDYGGGGQRGSAQQFDNRRVDRDDAMDTFARQYVKTRGA
jgi:hypothetical protein